jgi:hypothetical protein
MHQNNIYFKKLFFTLAYKNDLKIPKKLNLNKNSNFYKNILQLLNKKKDLNQLYNLNFSIYHDN